MKQKTANILISAIGLFLAGGVVYISLTNAKDTVASQPVVTKELAGITVPVVSDPQQTTELPIAIDSPQKKPTPKPVKTSPTPTPTPTPVPTPVVQNITGYRNGTYTASASYRTPESREQITVTLTLNNGIITNSSVAQSGNAGESRRYQDRFASGYQPYVIGKSITDLKLSRVSGSSLTPRGFNDAIAQIRTEASV